MTSEQTNVIYLVAAAVAFYYFWQRREAFAYVVRCLGLAMLCGAAAFLLLRTSGLTEPDAKLAALVVAAFTIGFVPRKRSRRISKRVQRQAIVKWERETGQTFNRRIHELDHKLAHSRGGGNAEDNIQVLTKKKNRSKGAKRHWREEEY